jgi:hypothetical protein
MVNHGVQEISSAVKFAPEGGIRGFDAFHFTAEMTCNSFQTELASHTKANNLFETVSLAVDRLSRPCPF